MRLLSFALLFICFLAITIASPLKDKKKPPSCVTECDMTYNPICSKTKNTGKERLITFGSTCVQNNYNCEHPNDQFEMMKTGECGGNVSVRLS